MEHGTTARPPLRGFRITSNEWCRRYIPSQKVVRCLHFHQLTFRIGFVLKCGSVEHRATRGIPAKVANRFLTTTWAIANPAVQERRSQGYRVVWRNDGPI